MVVEDSRDIGEHGGLMHNNNKCKQTNKSAIHKSNRRYYSVLLTIPPHALHNKLDFSYVTYMLHSLISYLTDIKANILMQSISCSALLHN
jgi:hypothetical protein